MARAVSSPEKYVEGVGRRKSSVARVRLYTRGDKGQIVVNNKDWKDYFVTAAAREALLAPLKILSAEKTYAIQVVARGGGTVSQAEAIALGLARALIQATPESRATLKAAGKLTRDARAKERRKFGLKKARKAPQWSKR